MRIRENVAIPCRSHSLSAQQQLQSVQFEKLLGHKAFSNPETECAVLLYMCMCVSKECYFIQHAAAVCEVWQCLDLHLTWEASETSAGGNQSIRCHKPHRPIIRPLSSVSDSSLSGNPVSSFWQSFIKGKRKQSSFVLIHCSLTEISLL